MDHHDVLNTSAVENDNWIMLERDPDYLETEPEVVKPQKTPDAAKFSDASFTDVTITNNLEVKEKFYVNSLDMIKEINDAKFLKSNIEHNVSELNSSIRVMQNIIESFPNKQLSVYNIASEISYTNFQDMISPSTILVQNASFFGRLEDSTVNLNLQFIIRNVYPYEEFSLELPHEIDGILDIIPATVVVYFNYDAESDTWGIEIVFVSGVHQFDDIQEKTLHLLETF